MGTAMSMTPMPKTPSRGKAFSLPRTNVDEQLSFNPNRCVQRVSNATSSSFWNIDIVYRTTNRNSFLLPDYYNLRLLLQKPPKKAFYQD